MNLIVLSGHCKCVLCRVLKWSDIIIIKNAAVINAAVITTHHEIALIFRLKLSYFVIFAVITAAVITTAFKKLYHSI